MLLHNGVQLPTYLSLDATLHPYVLCCASIFSGLHVAWWAPGWASRHCLRRLKLHGHNHTKCTKSGPCRKIFFTRAFFLKQNFFQTKISFLPFLPFCAFSRTAKDKKNLFFQWKMMSL